MRRIKYLLLLPGICLSIEIGRIEIKGEVILISIKGARYLNVETLNPPEIKSKRMPNADPFNYAHIYSHTYIALCYGDLHLREGEGIYGSLKKVEDKWVIDTLSLPKRETYRVLPLRLCPCFSDEKLNSVDTLNEGLDNFCAHNVMLWTGYTHRKLLKEAGLDRADFLIKIKDAFGVRYKEIKVSLPKP